MADLDIEALEKQLHELKAKRAEARDRLDASRGVRGRGRGPPGMGGRGLREPQRPGVFSRLGSGGFPGARDGPAAADGPASSSRPTVFDRLYGRGDGPRSAVRDREADRDRDERDRRNDASRDGKRDDRNMEASPPADPSNRAPPITSRLSSRVVVEHHDHNDNRKENRNGILARTNSGIRAEEKQREGDEQPAAAPSRKRLLSAVLVNGEARTISAPLDGPAGATAAEGAAAEAVPEEPPPKRPTLKLDDSSKRRVQRMFGVALQGTLKKAKDEDAAFRSSTAAQRRKELEQRAIEKAEAEAAKLREEAAAARRQEREEQIHALQDLNLKSEITQLELAYAKRIKRKQELLTFCVTKTGPPLYWAPREASDGTTILLQAHAAQFEEWKQQQLEQLEADKAQLQAKAAERRQLAAQRAAAGADKAANEQQEGEQQQGGDAAAAAEYDEEQQQEHEQVEEEAVGEADDEMQDAAEAGDGDEAAAAAEEQPEEEAAAGSSRRSRQRQLGSEDEEEERLLSSDEDDE